MPTVVDSINVVNSLEEAPDRLRAEIGRYYSPETRGPFNTGFAIFRSGIKKDFVHELGDDNTRLVPTKTARIFVSGREEQFRDQTQWAEYVSQTIKTNQPFLDHQFSLQDLEVESDLVKNFHNPSYEDLTKIYGSNQLLNYNLINYTHKEEIETVRRIADLVSIYDDETYLVNSREKLADLFEQFPNRISNYSGSIEEIDLKQRNIFQVQGTSLIPGSFGLFPYYYFMSLPTISSGRLRVLFVRHSKFKNIFQALKQDLSFTNRDFNIGTQRIQGKIYDLLSLVNSTRMSTFTEQSDELFLVHRNQTDHSTMSRRFVEQVGTVNLISDIRSLIVQNARGLKDILEAQPCESFFIGYKIEKYLDNDLGTPIQTYYTVNRIFHDTQLKYGRRYIYKTKALIGILGSSYTYSNLFVSQNETEMISESGEVAETSPSGFSDISSEKYRAYVDVEITPSFQVLEHEFSSDEVAFVDSPPPVPQVHFFNDSKKRTVEFFLSPSMPGSNQIGLTPDPEGGSSGFERLTDEDDRINELLTISHDSETRLEYFTGVYEIYRMSTPPESVTDFSNHFLMMIDDSTTLSYPSSMQLPTEVADNMNGHFEDFLVPNRKYYYLFRALSYHGTPSNPTTTYEVELQRDSDEYKIVVSEYKYPSEKGYKTMKTAKRIVRVIPNLDRLLFSEEESNTNWRLDDGSLLNNNQAKKFKIRVTSKHTGKKIDINLSFLLDDRTNNQQN